MVEAAFDFYKGMKPVAPVAAKRESADLLSPLLLELEGIIGLEATLKLVDRWGGVQLYVPETMDANHAIAGLIGIKAAEELASYYGRERLNIPLARNYHRARRNRDLWLRHKAGESASQLALAFGISLRQVWEILAAERVLIDKEKYRKLMKGRK
jgi:Mor family transcriptional regulator